METRESFLEDESVLENEYWDHTEGEEVKKIFENPRFLELSEFEDPKIKHIVDVKWFSKPESSENEVYLSVLYFTVGDEMP